MAILFDDYDDLVALTQALANILADKATGWAVSIWLEPGASAEADYFLDAFSVSTKDEVRFTINSAGSLAVTYDDDTFGFVTASHIQDYSGNWVHVVATCDASNLKLYINKVLKDTADVSGSANLVNLQPVLLGTRQEWTGGIRPGGDTSYYSGKQTEFAMWDKVLVQGNVDTLFGNGSPTKGRPETVEAGNLKCYLSMTDGEIDTSADGDTVYDSTVNNNDGLGDNGANNTGLMWSDESDLFVDGIIPQVMHHRKLAARG